VPNLVIAKLGLGGQVTLFNSAGNTQFVADVVGWFPSASGLRPLSPTRLLDTRQGRSTADGLFNGVGAVGQAQTLNLTVDGRAGLPASGVDSVVLNVTVADATSSGYVTVYPAGTAIPTASNLNFVPGTTVPNLVIAKVGADGQVSLFNSAGTTNLVVDIVGWFAA
jgi:hypothetical protein